MSEKDTDNTTYYYSNGQRIPLVREPGAFAVRFRDGAKSDSHSLTAEARSVIRDDSEHLGFIPNHNLQIYKLAPETDAGSKGDAALPHTAFSRLQADPSIEFTAPVYKRGTSDDMILVTRRFVAQFKPNVTRAQIDELNARHGVTIVEPLGFAENGYVLRAPEADGPSGPVALGNLYFESGLTEFAHADLITKRYFRSSVATMADVATMEATPQAATARDASPAYQSQQWHLTSANVIDAWSITRGSPEIKVCILDDGVDVDHVEFANKVVEQFDFRNDVIDARPNGVQDNHGTCCAGVAVAAGVKAIGVAPGCSLIAAVIPTFLASTDEARMFRWAADKGADVISCSWGPRDGLGTVDPLPDLTRAAIQYCVTQGRGGKGCAVLWAAGNGFESVSNDGYASNPDVMAIAASTDADAHAAYSDFGPEVFICAPSNGGAKGILTADRRGTDGYNVTNTGLDDPARPWLNDPFSDLDYTSIFGGTSSSTPLVAGIVGLMLSANPDLTPSQIRQCLKNTVVKIGPAGTYDTNGHSPKFGFGKVNAGAAVREAQRLRGGSTGTSTGTPTITAQQPSASRSGSPPSFSVDPRPNTHYAIEVAARRELLDVESGQPLTEYYASWEDSSFMNAPVYTLPQAAWDRVKNNNQLFYRAWTSASATAWQNPIPTTGTGGGAAAASIQIVAEQQSSGTPTMSGPASAARSGQPPSFTIDPGSNTHYTVEFAARREILDMESGQPAGEYYASWSDTPFMSARTYQLPSEIWDQLSSNPRLFFRAWTSSSATSWADVRRTAETGATAPVMEITDGFGESRKRSVTLPGAVNIPAVQKPQIIGPETANAAGVSPEFRIVPGRNRYYAVEVAVDPADLTGTGARKNPSWGRFYSSWVDGMRAVEGVSTNYSLPQWVWEQLARAALDHGGRLYYRLITAADEGWSNEESSLTDVTKAPGIDIWSRSDSSPLGPDLRPEEALWRTPSHSGSK